MILKRCNDCKDRKPLEDFSNRTKSKDGKQARCKICAGKRNIKWLSNNEEKFKKITLRYRLKKYYNITEETYNKLLENQNYKCKICGVEHSIKKPLAVDHCHETKQTRGLLCRPCNSAIGLFKHNISFLNSAINYLNV